ncbi:unnamed protein product [Amoebophrya sp. A25]|nr:unnamed protein product [Amoebophrya sp. A25]|eukprot:GSA25T00003702001.1
MEMREFQLEKNRALASGQPEPQIQPTATSTNQSAQQPVVKEVIPRRILPPAAQPATTATA